MFEYIFVYIMIDVFCMFFSIVILSKITIDMGTEREVNALRWFIVMLIMFIVTDAWWAMGTYGYIPMPSVAVGLIEDVTMLFMGAVSYFWFVYAENKLKAPFANHRLFLPLAAIPLMVNLLLYLSSFWTGWVFVVNGGVYNSGPLDILPQLIFLLYAAFITVHAFVKFTRESSSTRRREDLTLVTFILLPVICGIIDIFIHGMPVMALSVFSSVLLVFMNSQDSRINTDALTGLNNRRRAVEYAEETISAGTDGAPFAVFMVDIDWFKDINDRYGHAAGDRALQIVADGLRAALDTRHGLASRWGGDEFLLAARSSAFGDLAGFEETVRVRTEEARCAAGAPYRIGLSIGYASTADGFVTLGELVDEADKHLYEEKELHHAQGLL